MQTGGFARRRSLRAGGDGAEENRWLTREAGVGSSARKDDDSQGAALTAAGGGLLRGARVRIADGVPAKLGSSFHASKWVSLPERALATSPKTLQKLAGGKCARRQALCVTS